MTELAKTSCKLDFQGPLDAMKTSLNLSPFRTMYSQFIEINRYLRNGSVNACISAGSSSSFQEQVQLRSAKAHGLDHERELRGASGTGTLDSGKRQLDVISDEN